MKNMYKGLLGILGLLIIQTSFGQYDPGDTTVINAIKTNNYGTSLLNWDDADPANWLGIIWDNSTPKRIIELELAASGKNGGTQGNFGSSYQPTVIAFSKNPSGWSNAGVTVDLTGNVDFSGLDKLERLILQQNTNITSIDVSGCTSLKELYTGQLNIETLDVSGLTNLEILWAKNMSNVKTVDATGCTSLVRASLAWADSLKDVNMTNCSSLETLNMKDTRLETLNLTGTGSLIKLVANSKSYGSSLSSIPGLTSNSNIRWMGLNYHELTSLDVTGLDSLRRICFRSNEITQIIGANSLPKLERINADNNRLSLTDAVNLANNTNASTTDLEPQQNDGECMVYSSTLDYSSHDSIDVSGSMVSSTFNLYTAAGALDSTNTTGLFDFTLADTGAYYVTMLNSGITVTTDTIWVLPAASSIATTISAINFGDVEIGQTATQTLTVSNTGNASLDVSNITLPAGYTAGTSTATIAGADSTNITVTFAPTLVQTYAGTIMVESDACMVGSNTVSVTGNGIDVIGITEENQSLIRFYPNPTQSVLNIETKSGVYNTLSLFSVEGKLIQTIDLNGNTQIDMTDMPNGIYIIRSTDGVINQRIIRF